MWDGWCVGKLNEESWRQGSQKSEPPIHAGRRRQCRGLSGCSKPHIGSGEPPCGMRLPRALRFSTSFPRFQHQTCSILARPQLSVMDPVSLALGIAPLCVGALKGAKLAKTKIKLLKHYDTEVSRFRKKFRTQVSIFRDESQLLLHNAAVDPDLAAVMLDDYNHKHWTSADLDDQIRHFLGKKHSEVKQVAEQIRDQIAKFDQDLSKLEADSDEESSNGKVSSSSRKPGLEFSADFGFSARHCSPPSPSCDRGCF